MTASVEHDGGISGVEPTFRICVKNGSRQIRQENGEVSTIQLSQKQEGEPGGKLGG